MIDTKEWIKEDNAHNRHIRMLAVPDWNGVDYGTFDHKDTPVFGVNGTPIIDMEPYVDTNNFTVLHDEMIMAFIKLRGHNLPAWITGELNPDYCTEYFGEKVRVARDIMVRINEIDPSGKHLEKMNALTEEERYFYLYYEMGGSEPWFQAFHLRRNDWLTRDQISNKYPLWEPAVEPYFPQTIDFINKLPYKVVTRVIVYGSFPRAGVPCHRDDQPGKPHRDHSINFFFNSGRPFYVYDHMKKEKHYSGNSKAIFFNNRDYHGIDPEPSFRYTLRVDGVFEDWLCEKINLKDNGYL